MGLRTVTVEACAPDGVDEDELIDRLESIGLTAVALSIQPEEDEA